MTAAVPGTAQITWSTAVSAVEPELIFRGYRAEDLAHHSTYLETAYLLNSGELPSNEQLADWQALLLGGLNLPERLLSWLGRVPEIATPMEVMSGALVRMRLSDGVSLADGQRELRDSFPYWLGVLTAVVTTRWRLSRGLASVEPRDDLGFVGNLWWLIHGREASPWMERALEGVLITLADHGMSPATVAIRLAAAGGTDFQGALQLGTVMCLSDWPVGQGGRILELLAAARTPAQAPRLVEQSLSHGEPLPGFVHRLFRVGDPRADWIGQLCRQAADRLKRHDREQLATAIEQAVWDQQRRLPNIGWPAARLLDYLGFDQALFAPLYVLARMAGWSAHFAEQRRSPGPPATITDYLGPGLQRLFSNQERT